MAAASAPAAVQRSQNMPSRKITQMPGVKNPVNSWMYWNAWSKLPSSGLAMMIAMISATTAVMRPTSTRWRCDALRPQRPVHIHREDRGDGVDLGSHRGHDGRDQRREHQSQDTRRQHGHQMRIGLIRAREIGRQGHGGDAGQNDDHRHQQLQEGGEHDALLRFADVSWPPAPAE